MINLIPITTDNGTYKAIHCDTEDGTLFYGVDFRNGSEYEYDVATFQVHSDGSAEGFCTARGIYVTTDENNIFRELVEAVDKTAKKRSYGYL